MSASSGSIGVLSALKGQNMEGLKSFKIFSNGEAVLDAYNGMGAVPNFNVFGVNFGEVPSFTNFSILLLVPVLTFGVYFLSSKVSRKLMNTQPQASNAVEKRQMACSNVMMDIMMPALSTYFTFVVPALIGVYWIFRCLLNMLKQFIIARIMPLPVFTEEDYKAAAREMAGKRPVVKKSSNVGKVRSLHHIDDEDFDDTRDRALARKAAIEEREREERAKREANKPAMAAPLKKDNKKDQKPEETKAETEEAKVEEAIDEKAIVEEAVVQEAAVETTEAPIEETTETNEKTDEE
jgi:membrane protein insertase Oxa1/YidC/SpoIIIJ